MLNIKYPASLAILVALVALNGCATSADSYRTTSTSPELSTNLGILYNPDTNLGTVTLLGLKLGDPVSRIDRNRFVKKNGNNFHTTDGFTVIMNPRTGRIDVLMLAFPSLKRMRHPFRRESDIAKVMGRAESVKAAGFLDLHTHMYRGGRLEFEWARNNRNVTLAAIRVRARPR